MLAYGKLILAAGSFRSMAWIWESWMKKLSRFFQVIYR